MTSTAAKCLFVSDLHLFANRSNAHRHLHAIAESASCAGAFVLGGDIFDFRWANIPTLKAVDLAVRWLGELTASCPDCQFHLVLGNHDYHQAFIDRLIELEPRVSNLSWHRYYVRLGSSVFLHGDVADKEMDARMLAEAREEWLDAPPPRPLAQQAVRRRDPHPAAQTGAVSGILQANCRAADSEILAKHRPRSERRRAQRVLRPHAPKLSNYYYRGLTIP